MIPLRPFGKTGVHVSALGLGGSHIGKVPREADAIAIMRSAIEAGITFFDNAWEYEEGKSEKRMGKALTGEWRPMVFLMTKCCTHGRDGKVAMKQLEESLRRLKTDYLDLWQLHECVYYNDPERHFMKGGAAEALLKARDQGKVRFLGFTGHKDPAIHLKMLAYDYPFDACQLPLNVFDASFKSFERLVLPELNRRGIAPIGMKSLGGEAPAVKKKLVAATDALRYAMSLPVATTVSGIDSMKVLKQNIGVANNFKPMKPIEMARMRTKMSEFATDGRFEHYKTTAKYDADEGRRQHGFPLLAEMAG